MTQIDPNAPAYPQHGWSPNPDVVARMQDKQGLTIRAEFTKAAMQAILSHSIISHSACFDSEDSAAERQWREHVRDRIGAHACGVADAVIAALNAKAVQP